MVRPQSLVACKPRNLRLNLTLSTKRSARTGQALSTTIILLFLRLEGGGRPHFACLALCIAEHKRAVSPHTSCSAECLITSKTRTATKLSTWRNTMRSKLRSIICEEWKRPVQPGDRKVAGDISYGKVCCNYFYNDVALCQGELIRR